MVTGAQMSAGGRDGGGFLQVSYDEAQPVVLTRSFLADPQRYLHYLFSDDG